MKTVLWSQGESTELRDLYVGDGKVVTDQSQKDDLARFLLACRKDGSCHKYDMKSAIKEGRLRENAFLSITDKGIFISSNYLTKDVVDRLIVYEFYCETSDINEALKALKECSSVINRECDDKELEEFKRIAEEQKTIETSIVNTLSSESGKKRTLILFLVAAALLLLLKKCLI